MKVCSLYGAGFYYIPGTDMCLKVGGWTRFEAAWHANNSSVGAWIGDLNDRFTNNMWYRVRGYITADAREQTAYGVARAYIAVGLSTGSVVNGATAANQFDANRAFIQWAGFTFGRTVSFYDFYAQSAVGYNGWVPSEESGDGGWDVAAYTAQFGNGWSATVSLENGRRTQIVNVNGLTIAGGVITGASFSTAGSTTNSAGAYGGWNVPDIVGNLRVDQTWGSAQLMGAAHQVRGTYYNGSNDVAGSNPGDKWGFVVGGGIKLNAPMIGQGDYLQAEANYTQGALRYLATPQGAGNFYMQNGTTVGMGILSDAVYGGTVAGANTTGLDLTTGWSVNAAYEHFWSPAWKTSLYGAYVDVKYNTEANAMLCSAQGFGAGAGNAALATAGCTNNWNMWAIGSRTQWNITKSFYMGLDVSYGRIHGLQTPTGLTGATNTAANSGCAAGTCSIGDTNNWTARFRVHKDFYP